MAYTDGMEESIFTKIIKGEIPCHKIYEDDTTLAFLDINPAAEAHTLVVPKKQVEFVWDLDDEEYKALMNTTKKIARHLRRVSEKPFVGEMVVGVDVPHAHIHLIPFETTSQLANAFNAPTTEPDHEKLASIAEKYLLDA